MAVTAHAIANAFLKLAKSEGKTLTNMQLQKLVFLAQGYSLALLDREIYRHNTHAWQWGPVVPKLYKSLQKYGSDAVTETLTAPDELLEDSEEYGIVEGVWEAYKGYSGSKLSAISHRPGSPWDQQWREKQFDVIPLDRIKAYYRDLVGRE